MPNEPTAAGAIAGALGAAAGGAATGGIPGAVASTLADLVHFALTTPQGLAVVDQLLVDHGLTADKVATALKREHLTTDRS